MDYRRLAVVTTLMLIVASMAHAQQQPRERTISVRGTGKVRVVPDHLRLTIQVNVPRAENAVDALSRNNRLTSAVIAVLKSFKIADADVQTTRVTVNPVYDYDKRISPPPIVGYSAQNEILVTIRNMDDAGRILDQTVKSGATGFGPLAYESSKRAELEREALKRAADDARERAQLLAKQLGATVGNVVFIGETGLGVPDPRPKMMGMEARASADVPVMPGEMEITAYVEVLFELK
jgi:uncharacterized protein YggE